MQGTTKLLFSVVLVLAGLPALPAVADELPQATQRVETSVNNPNNPADVEESFVKLYYPLPGLGGYAHR